MELEELRDIWKEDHKKLENRIELNEKLIHKMNMSQTTLEVDKLISKAIVLRNCKLVYCVITLIIASVFIEKLEYSIPAILGSMAMLWSFIDQLSITKPDYSRVSLIELQKSICDFRIRTSKKANYDIAINLFWQITSAPLCLLLPGLKISIYSNLKYFAIFSLFTMVNCILVFASFKKRYATDEQKLKYAESDLEKIMEFEKV